MLSFLSRSRILLLMAVACASAGPVRAQNQIQDQPASAPPTYPVRGVVLNRLTHQPIARALVEGQFDAALTDSEGRFELNLSQQLAQISVRRPGYKSNSQENMHMVRLGPQMPELTFYLTPQAGVTGHVTLSTGDDADGIRFTTYRLSAEEGRPKWRLVETIITNSEGVFRLPNLDAPGSYVICSMPTQDRNGAVARGATRFGYPSVCYPAPFSATANPSPANLLNPLPGQQTDVEITLTRQPFYPVSISAPNAPRGQGMGIQIHDQSGRVMDFSTRWNQQQGLAEVNLPNGQYYAEANLQGQTHSYGRLDFRVANAPVSGLSMALVPLHPVQVQIRKEFTEARPADQITTIQEQGSQGAPLNLNLSSADPVVDGGFGGLQPVPGSGDNTLFQIPDLIPGSYWVKTFPFEGYVSSITSGGVDLTREPLVVGPGGSAAPIQITLRNDTGQIQCTVNSSSTPGALPGSVAGEVSLSYIYASPLSRSVGWVQPAQMESPGQATISNLAPGNYRVAAFDQPQDVDLFDSQKLARLTANGQSVTVTAGAISTVQLDLIHTVGDGADSSSGSAELGGSNP